MIVSILQNVVLYYVPASMMDKVMAKLMVSLFNLSTVCWARPWNRRNIIWSDAVWHWQCSSQPEPGSSTERQACTVSATPPIWPVRQFNESDLAIAKVALFLDLLSWTGLISCPWKKVAKSKGRSPGETNAFVQALPELTHPPAP